MAAAAGPSNWNPPVAQPIHIEPLPLPPPQTPVLPASLPPPPPLATAPVNPASTSTSTTAPVPAKKPVSPTIGMNPDSDSNSKHGIFNYSPLTITSVAQNGAHAKPHVPNPARTLVMEQLPKTHRTKDFVKSWCKGACGSNPVYWAVDPQSAKALVEFTTAELARKAWGSPKLSPPGHPIKGKPRADLIRVWWYRVEGVGAGAGVGELEEGEVEGDEDEREASLPPSETSNQAVKKETKKEKKARLARERLQRLGNAKMQPNVPIIPPSPYPSTTSLYSASMQDDIAPYSPQNWPMGGWNEPSTSSFAHWQPPALPAPPPRELHVPSYDLHIAALVDAIQPAKADNTDVVDADMELDTPASDTVPFLLPDMDDVATGTGASSPVITQLSSSGSRGSMTPPMEPRAMKNVPKGPSYVKRSLLARQKELEERIAKGKMELERRKGATPDVSPAPAPTVDAPPLTLVPPPVEDAASMENNLRQLVLKSQRNRLKQQQQQSLPLQAPPVASPPSPTAVSPPPPPPPPSASILSSAGSSQPPSPTTSVAVSAFSLDDLAVSFITETIQNYVPAPKPTLKEELAAKQRRLEEHIAETKALMAQLAAAKTKPERDRIMAIIREKSRQMESNLTPTPTPTATPFMIPPPSSKTTSAVKPVVPLAPVVRLRWPESRNDVCVLVISDDEDEDEDESDEESAFEGML
ncbi:Fecal droplet protein [Mycena kentingensis (nom. inval.)]|nr:Fecal droplet protein [Mycena kentingensis (nom. inval.)]